MIVNHGRDLFVASLHLMGVEVHGWREIRADFSRELQKRIEITIGQAVKPVSRVGDFVIIAHSEAFLR